MRDFALEAPPPRRLVHFTPLRYPGGKGKLAAYVKEIIKENRLLDGEYVEPYAGGAAIGLELLFHEYVSRIHINDLSRPIYAFWKCVLHDTDRLCKLIRDTSLTSEAWAVQKWVFANQAEHDDLALGFAAFYLNRTNRSGIFNGGVIGGRNQSGPWKMDARFNREELLYRIEAIAKIKQRINLTHMDALDFLKVGALRWPEKTLVYLDPPYYVKGRDLYYDYYQPRDHRNVAAFVTGRLARQRWIVSYDNVPEIRNLYKECQCLVYEIGYSARQSSPSGKEAMFFDDSLRVPPLVGSMRCVRGANTIIKEGICTSQGEGRASKAETDQFSGEETAQRHDEIVRVLANTPPQPRSAKRPAKLRRMATSTASVRRATSTDPAGS